MVYAEYSDYTALYGTDISQTDFNRLVYDASSLVDHYVTTVDGVNKLKFFFPTDEDDVEAVKRCTCALVNTQYQVEQIQSSAGVIQHEDGTVTGKTVTSISSGSESMSFASGSSSASVLSEAAKSEAVREELITSQVFRYLRGHKDKNGVNLLYVGVYPYVQQNNYTL